MLSMPKMGSIIIVRNSTAQIANIVAAKWADAVACLNVFFLGIEKSIPVQTFMTSFRWIINLGSNLGIDDGRLFQKKQKASFCLL